MKKDGFVRWDVLVRGFFGGDLSRRKMNQTETDKHLKLNAETKVKPP